MAGVISTPWYKSKTLWANAVMAATTTLAANLPILQPILGPVFYVSAVSVVAGVNMFLRLLTDTPITGVAAITASIKL